MLSAPHLTVDAHSVGIGWTGILVGVLNVLVGGVLVALIKSRPKIKEIAANREMNLLSERAEAMSEMAKRIEKLEAERSIDRHRLNNVTQCLDALLMLLEIAPEKAAEHVVKIKKMRADQMVAEAAEKGAIRAAALLGQDQ